LDLKRSYPSVMNSTDVSPHNAMRGENDPHRCIYGLFEDPVPNACWTQPWWITWHKTTRKLVSVCL